MLIFHFLARNERHRDRARVRRPVIRAVAGAAGLSAIAAIITVPALAASAASAATFYVATTGSASAADTSCATAAYSSVQSAVTAAEAAGGSPAPVIYVCPGTYTEQVTITSSLVIERAHVAADLGAAVIELPASVGSTDTTGLSTTNCQAKDTSAEVPQSVIEICAAATGGVNTKGVSVSISDVTVQGNWPDNSFCYDSLYDVLVEGGATLSLTDSAVTQAGDYPLNGCQGGVGVQVGFSPTGQVGHAVLANDTIDNYQKNGITVDGSGSTAQIADVTVTGDGPTSQIAQNGIQISFGATGSVTGSIISGNNYTGTGEASSDGILVVGGGGSACGIGAGSPLARKVSVTGNALLNNDIGVQLFNVNASCTKSSFTPTDNVVCDNTIVNYHGYTGGIASADANISGFGETTKGVIGDQAGVSDSGFGDKICDNAISGVGYQSRDSRKSLPNPAGPAWVRPIDIYSFAPAIKPVVKGNTYDGKKYLPQ